ncbi:hypothetical protein GCM10020369_82330 [Cryptosporangium minutisporangium]|uniref:Uncharacterized protein n=1 Tax=Cryptosporangium minutisporangium TaxID=113569 RepID=A0ABP6TBR6_9ACTN
MEGAALLMQNNPVQNVADSGRSARDDLVEQDLEIDPDNHADVAEEFAEEAGIDPTPHQVEEYVALQDPHPAP